MKKVITPTEKREYAPAMRHLDFCVTTFENREGLERLLHSIAEDSRYKGANVYIADSNRTLDRAYYKQLRTRLGEAGLISRLKIHPAPFKASIGAARNLLVSVSSAKYKVFLTDSDFITEETDLLKFVAVFDGNKAVGVVGGSVKNGEKLDTPSGDEKVIDINGVKCSKSPAINSFMAVRRDLFDSTRYNPDAPDQMQAFFTAVKKAPYEMVVAAEVIIGRGIIENDDESTKGGPSRSTGNGSASEPTVPNQSNGNQGGSNSAPGRQNEESKNTNAGGRQSGSGPGPVQGQGNK